MFLKLIFDILFKTMSYMRNHGGGYLEDLEGFRQNMWRRGLSLMSYMVLFDPEEDPLKFCIGIC